jgi:hypothetical protein
MNETRDKSTRRTQSPLQICPPQTPRVPAWDEIHVCAEKDRQQSYPI